MGLDGEVAIFQGKIEMLNLVIFKDWHLSAQFGSNLPYIFFSSLPIPTDKCPSPFTSFYCLSKGKSGG